MTIFLLSDFSLPAEFVDPEWTVVHIILMYTYILMRGVIEVLGRMPKSSFRAYHVSESPFLLFFLIFYSPWQTNGHSRPDGCP